MNQLEETKTLSLSGIQQLLSSRELMLVYAVILVVWGLYRLLFRLPTWFEEIVLKGLVFGGSVWLVSLRNKWNMADLGLKSQNLALGVYLGIAMGMMLGVVGQLGNIWRHGGLLLSNFGLTSGAVGGFIILSLITAFWEQLLFCGYIFRQLESIVVSEWLRAWVIALLFVGLHLPAFIFVQRLAILDLLTAVILLFLLQLGNVILMLRFKNLIAPIMAHALWGVTIFLFR